MCVMEFIVLLLVLILLLDERNIREVLGEMSVQTRSDPVRMKKTETTGG